MLGPLRATFAKPGFNSDGTEVFVPCWVFGPFLHGLVCLGAVMGTVVIRVIIVLSLLLMYLSLKLQLSNRITGIIMGMVPIHVVGTLHPCLPFALARPLAYV